MRSRKRDIKDMYLSKKDIQRLRKGYALYKNCRKETFCLHLSSGDRSIQRRIAKYKQKIRELERRGTEA